MSVPYMQTKGGINLVLGTRHVSLSSEHVRYSDVLAVIKKYAGQSEDEVSRKAAAEEIIAIVDAERIALEAQLSAATASVELTDKVKIEHGVVLFEGRPMTNYLCERLIEIAREGLPVLAMARFLERLKRNPSRKVVERLYAFLEKGGFHLTEDGHFLAYKAVRPDYGSIHATPSGEHIDNSIGQRPFMERNEVNEDDRQTCSDGLHVCSFSYLPSFSHANGHVMVCKVDPENVVSIPVDYNDAKMRVCLYEVIAEHPGYYQNEGKHLVASVYREAELKAPFKVIGFRDRNCFEAAVQSGLPDDISDARVCEIGGVHIVTMNQFEGARAVVTDQSTDFHGLVVFNADGEVVYHEPDDDTGDGFGGLDSDDEGFDQEAYKVRCAEDTVFFDEDSEMEAFDKARELRDQHNEPAVVYHRDSEDDSYEEVKRITVFTH